MSDHKCPMTAQLCYDDRGICKPGYCRRQLHPAEQVGETPRTDARINSWSNPAPPVFRLGDALNLARQLERELAELKVDFDEQLRRTTKAEREVAELRHELGLERESHEITKRMYSDADEDAEVLRMIERIAPETVKTWRENVTLKEARE